MVSLTPRGCSSGDGSDLFVPDNPAYEGSVVLWFDEHNHPVNYEELSPAQRKKAHRERCYKLVSRLPLWGGNYVCAAVAVVPGNRHELPVLYQWVEAFVRHVGHPSVPSPTSRSSHHRKPRPASRSIPQHCSTRPSAAIRCAPSPSV